MKISKKVQEVLDTPDTLHNQPTGYSADVADLANYNPAPFKSPRDEGYLDEFIIAYGIAAEDVGELREYVNYEAAKIMREHFNRIIQFFKECNIPKVYILAVMIDGCDKNIVEIANRLGITKQAVHKHLRRLDPHFSKFGKFYSRQRNFKDKESNANDQQ